MRPRMWALLALAALLVIVVAMPGGDPDPADSAAVARGGPLTHGCEQTWMYHCLPDR